MKVLVIGAGGQLGRHLRSTLPDAEFWDRSVVDLTDARALCNHLDRVDAAAVVNAAAYTAVDRAETERDTSWRVNAEAPASIARAAERLDIPLVHISTDYVFDGRKAGAYIESDGTHPLNEYGRSKLGGELAVSSLCRKFWILRSSWVFSQHGSNFLKTMLRLSREKSELRVVDDQFGRPTYAGDLAHCITNLVAGVGRGESPPWGLYHVGGGRVVSWRDFAETIIDRAVARGMIETRPRVARISTHDYPTAAMRPANSVLEVNSAQAAWMGAPFDWERGLETALAALGTGSI